MGNKTKTLTEHSEVLFLNSFPTERRCSLLRGTGNGVFYGRIVERRAWRLRARRLRLWWRLLLWHGHGSVVTATQNNGRVIPAFGFGFSLQISFAGLRVCPCNLPNGDPYHLVVTRDADRSAGLSSALGGG